MAQEIEYFESYVTFREGPFVVVDWGPSWKWHPTTMRWQIRCSRGTRVVQPNDSIYSLRERLGFADYRMIDGKEKMRELCDILNEMVKDEKIVQDECGVWVWKGEF